jgi:hypothetical protein
MRAGNYAFPNKQRLLRHGRRKAMMDIKSEHRSDYLYIHMSGDLAEEITPEGRPASLAKACRDGNYRCLLIDMRELIGEIGSSAYFRFGEEIARAFAFNVIRIAIVGSVEQVRQLSLIENIVTRQGGVLKVFTDIDKAAEWLL